jgi:hypothetical protein
MPHTTRRLLKRRCNETEGSQDDEQVEITSLDHPGEPIDQRKRQFLTRTLQAAMLAYIGVSTPASFVTEVSSPLERVDEAYGAVRNVRPHDINKGGLFYPMRKQIRENFLVSLQSVFEQGSSPLAASKQWN